MARPRQLALRCALTLSLGAASAVAAQSRKQTAAPAPRHPIRVATNEVTVPVTVTDRHGNLVFDLSENDFHVFDDGVEQKLDHWELGGDPLAVAMVIDTNSRLQSMAPSIHSLGIIFADTVMALDSEAAVLTYDSSVTERQPFTMNHDVVEKAIETAKFDGDGADLYDGMAKSVRLLQQVPPKWRRVMLVVGEAQDSGSTARLGEVARQAERANISIYVLGVSSAGADLKAGKLDPHPLKMRGIPPITSGGCGQYGTDCFDLATPALWLLERGTNAIKHHQLEVAAAATGGIDYSGFREAALQSALDRIGGELHAQYIIGYRPRADSTPGLHKIRVSVSRGDVTVRARPGYYFIKR